MQQAIQRLQTLIFAMEKDAEKGVESKVKEDFLIRSKIKSMCQPIWHKVKKQEQKELQAGETFTTKRLIEYVKDLDRLTSTRHLEEITSAINQIQLLEDNNIQAIGMKRSSSDAGLNDPNEKRSKSPLTIYQGAPGNVSYLAPHLL